jgi:predicted lipid-binding transport protein (Tim44 family)
MGLLGIGAILGLFLVARAHDGVMQFHASLFILFCLGGILWLVKRRYDPADPADPADATGYQDDVIKAW